MALVVPLVAGLRVCACGSGRVRGHAAIGICTHALVAGVVPAVAGQRVCVRGSGRVRGRAAIGVCTHAPVALVVPAVAARRVHVRARVGACSTCSSRVEGVRARVGAGSRTCCYWDLHPRACV